ncbi:MAG TPA: B12-binding domain-containing protein, partial [Candidatus Kryptobacter bacterium]|nr:B12-binding domain-containing protein [Candidatus Kryptobacter bacterium]
MSELEQLAQLLEDGNVKSTAELTQQMIDAGVNPQTVLNDGLIVGMGVVGEKMRTGEMYLPEVLQS